MPLVLRAPGIGLDRAQRIHFEPRQLVASKARHEHIVQRKIAREVPVLDALGGAEPAEEFHRADAHDHDAAELHPLFWRVLLYEEAFDPPPAQLRRKQQPDRPTAHDEDRNAPGHATARSLCSL